MNRRNFFKVVTGFVAGIFATSAKSKSPIIRSLMKVNPEVGAKRRSGTRYCGDELEAINESRVFHTYSSSGDYPACYGHYETPGALPCKTKCEYTEKCASSCKVRYQEWRRYEEVNRLIDPTREYFKVVAKELPPLLQKNIDDTIIRTFS